MKIYNSLTHQKEEFVPLHPGKVSIYVCGPTVYNHAHIGNTRPMIVFDVLRRLLLFSGYEVTYVSNYTDVDDKIINAAKEEGISEQELAEKYIQAYEKIRADLNLLTPTYTPRVTQTMDRMISFIDELVKNGSAYVVDGDVYFKVDSVADYGCLSGIRKEDLIAGARVEENDKKSSPLDFALWKKTTEGIAWDSPWSKGRPGWHTECVVMINDIFENGRIDIHGGGQDLKFPHHENEIAQSEACHHHKIATYWMHNQMINIDDVKMSKSLGNVKWAKDLIAELGPLVYKWLMLATHYRSPLNYTDETVSTARNETGRVSRTVQSAALYLQTHDGNLNAAYDEKILADYADMLGDDLNTSNALMMIMDEMKKLNITLRSKEVTTDLVSVQFSTLMKMCDILGLAFPYHVLTDEEKDLYQQWQEHKANKDYAAADELRARLMALGVL